MKGEKNDLQYEKLVRQCIDIGVLYILTTFTEILMERAVAGFFSHPDRFLVAMVYMARINVIPEPYLATPFLLPLKIISMPIPLVPTDS